MRTKQGCELLVSVVLQKRFQFNLRAQTDGGSEVIEEIQYIYIHTVGIFVHTHIGFPLMIFQGAYMFH